MRINARLVKSERHRRAWSQEHLASVSGLGVRTIHRIEKGGLASPESAKALAAIFELNVSDLTNLDHSITVPSRLAGLIPLLEALIYHAGVINEGIATMTAHRRLMVTSSLLCAALVCYWLSFPWSSALALSFLFVGAGLELLFWVNLIDWLDSDRRQGPCNG